MKTHAVKQVPTVAELLLATHSMFGNWTMENSENVSKMKKKKHVIVVKELE